MTRSITLLLLTASLAFAGCATQQVGENPADDEHDHEAPTEDGRDAEAAGGGADCSSRRNATGYKRGSSFAITVVNVDGKPVETATASSLIRMQRAAAADGVTIRVVSGFRTMAEQEYLYDLYLSGRGNLAAKPGYSNHQSGHALDLNASSPGVYSWLNRHADEYGFARTVPSENWHWEYWGAELSGLCGGSSGGGGGGGGGGTSSGCYSSTLSKQVVLNTCVQSKADRKWYQCTPGGKWEIRWDVAAKCVSEHAL